MLKSNESYSRKCGKLIWDNAKDPVIKKSYPKGQHGPAQGVKRRSPFGKQLAEKQYVRYHFGLEEKAMFVIMKKSKQKKGDMIGNMSYFLESRLATIIYRANFAKSIFAAGQMVSHKKVTVNGKVINLRGYNVKIGDVVEIIHSYQTNDVLLDSIKNPKKAVPSYLVVNGEKMTISLVRNPGFKEIPFPFKGIDSNLIISYYSRRI